MKQTVFAAAQTFGAAGLATVIALSVHTHPDQDWTTTVSNFIGAVAATATTALLMKFKDNTNKKA